MNADATKKRKARPQLPTSGKWFAGHPFETTIKGRGKCRLIGIGNGSCHIGFVSITQLVSEEEAIANARLIVHASDLLTALEAFVLSSLNGNMADYLKVQARDAIAKAKGQA
jgi:hypothetical protein